MNNAYIVAGFRSAVGKAGRGGFRFTRPDDLAADVIKHLVAAVPALDPDARPYWDERRRKRLEAQSLSKRRQELLRTQGYACAECGVEMRSYGSEWEVGPKKAKSN